MTSAGALVSSCNIQCRNGRVGQSQSLSSMRRAVNASGVPQRTTGKQRISQLAQCSLKHEDRLLKPERSVGLISTPKFLNSLTRRYTQFCHSVHPMSDLQENRLNSSALFVPLFFGGAEVGILAVIAVGLFIANFIKSAAQSNSLLPGPRNERSVSESSSSWGLSDDDYDDTSSVIRLQLGLLGNARELQTDLDRIADSADTSTNSGLHYILEETCLSLMRNPQYWAYANVDSKVLRTVDEAEGAFNNYSLDERGKLEYESLVNVDDRRKSSGDYSGSASSADTEYIVITVIISGFGRQRMGVVNSAEDVKAALRIIGSLPEENLQAIEVIWTPQEKGEKYTQQEMLQDFPSLTPL